MKCLLDAEVLSRALGVVVRAVPKKAPLAALDCILLEARDGRLRCAGTDLELWLELSVPVEVEEEGSALLPSVAADLVRRLSGRVRVELEAGDGGVFLKYGENVVRFGRTPVEDFPASFGQAEGEKLDLPVGFWEAVRAVAYAAKSEPDHLLNGVCLRVGPAGLRLEATDTYRLARAEMPVPVPAGVEFQVVLPSGPLSELARLGGFERVAPAGNVVLFEGADRKAVIRALEGRWPDSDGFIPTFFPLVARVSIPAARDCLARAEVVAAGEKASVVQLEFEGKRMKVSCRGAHGTLEETVAVETEGEEPFSIAFNPEFLDEALGHLGADDGEALLQFSGPLGAALIRSADENGRLMLVLPIRLL